mgnify:CR=1 FL=1
MKLKVVVVDMELSKNQRRLLVASVAAVALAAGATVALADVPKTFVAGQTLKAADLKENFDALDARTESVAARVTGMSSSIGTADSVLLFSSKDYDTHDAYDVATGGFTAPVAGRYRACSFLLGPPLNWTVGANFALKLFKNGTKVEDIASTYTQSAYPGGRLTANGCSSSVQLDAGDVIDLRAFQVTAAAPDLPSWCWAMFERTGD